MIRQIGVGLAMTIALALSVACDASDTKMERWAAKFTQTAIEVTAEELYQEFVRDDETAMENFSGRRIRVTGMVFEVRDDDDFEPIMEFDVGQDEWSFQSLIAQFAERHRTEVELWQKGDEVSVVCYIPVEDFGAFDFESVTPLRMCQPVELRGEDA